MLPCCCAASTEGSQVNYQPSDDRTAYDHAQGSSSAAAAAAAADAHFAPSEPLEASLPEPMTYEAGLPPPPTGAPEIAVGPAKPDKEEGAYPEDGPASAPPPPPDSSPPQDGAVPASDDKPAMAGNDKEKMRLQDLVREFAKRAMMGVPCSIVDLDNGDARPATYLVDRQLQKFTLKIDETAEISSSEETRHIGTISEIYIRKAGVEKLKPEAAAALDDESKDRLVVIVFSTGSLGLLESSAEEATSFAVCMRVLHVYCKQKGLC